ncbi:MAG: hypothetical protein HRT37_09830 [Alteromonadaceae bacterium]|nr:hypothetical protein [Alteromonadaceae bacterium]
MFKMMLLSELLRLKNLCKKSLVINSMLLLVFCYPVTIIQQQPIFSASLLFILTTCYCLAALFIGYHQSGLLIRTDNKTFLILRPLSLMQVLAPTIIAGMTTLLIGLILPLIVIVAISAISGISAQDVSVDLADTIKILSKVSLLIFSSYLSGFLANLLLRRISLIILVLPLLLLILTNTLQLSFLSLWVVFLMLIVATTTSFKVSNSKNVTRFNQRRALFLPISIIMFVILSFVLKLLFQLGIASFDPKHKGAWNDYFSNDSYQKVSRNTPEELQLHLVQQLDNTDFAEATFIAQLNSSFLTFSPLPGTLKAVTRHNIVSNQINIVFIEGNLLLPEVNDVSLLEQKVIEVKLAHKQADIKHITLYNDDSYSWLAVLFQEHKLWQGSPYLEFIQVEHQSGKVQNSKVKVPHAWSKYYLSSEFILSPVLAMAGGLNSLTYLTSTVTNLNKNILLITFVISIFCLLITFHLNKRSFISIAEKRFWLMANCFVGLPALLTYLLLFSLQKQVAKPNGVLI